MLFDLSCSKKFTFFVMVPAVVSVATSVLFIMLANEFYSPSISLAKIDNATTPRFTMPSTEIQQRVSQNIAPCKQTFDGKELSPSNNIVRYSWNFGDGETAEGQHVSHIFTLPGTYSVTMQAKTTTGAVEKQQVVVNIGKTCKQRPHNTM